MITMEKKSLIKSKKIVLTIMTLVASTMIMAQDYSIKKNSIFFKKEKDPVATFKKEKKEITFLDNNSMPLFNIKSTTETSKDGVSHYWVTLTDLKTNESNDIGVTYDGYYSNIEKQMLNFTTVAQPQIITKEGIDSQVLQNYITQNKKNYPELIAHINDSVKAIATRGFQALKDRNIKIEKDNTITEDGNDIGQFVIEEMKSQTGYDYAYYLYTGTGKDKMLYAAYIGGANFKSKDFTPYSIVGTTFYYLKAFDTTTWQIRFVSLSQKSKNLSSDPFAYEILANLYGAGYNLADGKAEINNYIREIEHNKTEKAKEAQEASKGHAGYVITPTGEKIEGLVSFSDTRNASLRNPGELGNIAKIVFKNNANTDEELLIKADEPNYIINVDVRGEMKTLKGLEVSYGSMTSLTSIASMITVGGKTFYMLVHEDEIGEIYQYQNRSDEFVLKLNSQEKGLYLKETSNKKKLHKAIRSYLKCEKIDLDDIKENSADGMKEILKRYKAVCQ